MSIISSMLLGLFIISAVLMILLIMFQDDQGEGVGGLFSSGNSPFRSRSGNLLQYITTGVAIFFFVSALGYALLMKPKDPLANLGVVTEDGTFLENLLENETASEENQGFNFNFDSANDTNAIGLPTDVSNLSTESEDNQ